MSAELDAKLEMLCDEFLSYVDEECNRRRMHDSDMENALERCLGRDFAEAYRNWIDEGAS